MSKDPTSMNYKFHVPSEHVIKLTGILERVFVDCEFEHGDSYILMSKSVSEGEDSFLGMVDNANYFIDGFFAGLDK